MKQIISAITMSVCLFAYTNSAFAEKGTDYCDLYFKLASRLSKVGKEFDKAGGFEQAKKENNKLNQTLEQTVIDVRRIADGEHDAKLTADVGKLEMAYSRKDSGQFRVSLDSVIAQVKSIYKSCKKKPKITVSPGIEIE